MLYPPLTREQRVEEVGDVAGRIDGGRGALEALVHDDAVVEDESASVEEADARNDPDADDREVGGGAETALGFHVLEPVVAAEARHHLLQQHVDAVLAIEGEQLLAQLGGAEHVEEAGAHVYQRHVEPELA